MISIVIIKLISNYLILLEMKHLQINMEGVVAIMFYNQSNKILNMLKLSIVIISSKLYLNSLNHMTK